MMKSILGISKIELAFYRMANKTPFQQEYFFSYYHQKIRLINHFYSHINEELKHFNDHGPNHIFRIFKIYEQILRINFPYFTEDSIEESVNISSISLNFFEIYLLLSATLWHDIYNLIDRNEHALKLESFPEFEKTVFIQDEIKNYILKVAKSHSGEDAIEKNILDDEIHCFNELIDLKFIAAVLRLADELDESEERIDWTYYKQTGIISDEEKIFWEFNHCIKRIYSDPDKRSIEINCYVEDSKIFEIFKKKGKKVALIDEIIYRINKINEERKYNCKFLSNKFLVFEKITLELKILKTDDSKPFKYLFNFDDSYGYNDFWNLYPKLNPLNFFEDKKYTLIGV